MAILFMDSFDDRTTGADVINRYDGNTVPGSIALSTSTGVRTGVQALKLINGAGVKKNVSPSGGTTLILGFSVNETSLNSTTILTVQSNLSSTAFTVQLLGSGGVSVTNSSSVTVCSVPSGTVTAAVTVYIQLKFVVNGSSSSVTLIVGSTTASSGAVTTSGTSLVSFTLQSTTNSSFTYFDDLVVLDVAGTANNDLPGQPKVECIRPTGAGSHTVLGLTGAATNWQAVADATPDGDTSYVSSATPGDIDSYAMGNLAATSGYVAGVQAVHTARKDDASVRQIATQLRIGGADYVGGTKTLTTVYLPQTDVIELNPATGLPFTLADVNAMEAGVKVIA